MLNVVMNKQMEAGGAEICIESYHPKQELHTRHVWVFIDTRTSCKKVKTKTTKIGFGIIR